MLSTVTQCLSSLFCSFGFPGCVHSNRGVPFVSRETRSFLATRGISFSTSTPYHPQGNSQCERSNQTIWRTTKLLLHTNRLSKELWETVLPETLHAVRSLVCLSTNETPHERFLRFPRKAMTGSGYCIRAPSFSAAMFETRATPCATRLTSWRVIRHIPWYVLMMARSAQFLRLTWRLFPGLPPSPKSSQQTLPLLPRHGAMWTVSSPIALAIRRQPPGLASPPRTDSFPSPPCADMPPLRCSTRIRKPPDRFGDWTV